MLRLNILKHLKTKRKIMKIKLFAMDVDGVLTDAGMYYGENGDEFKKFNTRDGMGISLLHDVGIKTAIITKETTNIVTKRAAKLGITEVHQGVVDKLKTLEFLASKYDLNYDEIAYVGDDINDIPILKRVGLANAVADADDKVKKNSDYVTKRKGGYGAVREIIDLILEN